MRILLVGLHRFTKPYGLCRYTATLFTSLRRVPSLDVRLVLGVWQRDYYRNALNLNVEDPAIIWIDLRKPGRSRYRWYLAGLPRLAKTLAADIVHALFPVPLIKPLFSCPIILTMHDLYAYDTPESIGFPNVYLNKAVLRMSIAASDCIVSISSYTRDQLLRWFPDLQSRMELPVVYQDIQLVNTSDPADSDPGSTRFLLCVAQHRKNKNLDLVVESYYEALRRSVVPADTELVIVGSDGSESQLLYAMTAQRGGVSFLNSITDAKLVRLYSRCEVLLCASAVEGFCLPVAEALLLSRRVVCSDIPVLREVAGNQATYFDLGPRSVEQVVTALADSLSSDRHLGLKSNALSNTALEAWERIYMKLSKRE